MTSAVLRGPGLGDAVLPDAATARQQEAADPRASTFVSANAGSGKTRVLTERVARLLLEGVTPDRILCMTFTKAAAAEMQNRLFRTLGEWAMLADHDLLRRLWKLDPGFRDRSVDLARARTLFATAIETPGGLRIQTIHAFCAALLRRFPLEAGVPPAFAEMEDRAGQRLREEVLAAMADGAHRDAIDLLARYHSGGAKGEVHAFAHEVAARERIAPRAALARELGLPPGFGESDLRALAWDGTEAALFAEAVPLLLNGTVTDQKLAARITILRPHPASLPDWEGAFLYGPTAATPFAAKVAGTKSPNVTKGTRANGFPEDAFDAMQLRIEAARGARQGLVLLERTEALAAFRAAFAPLYRAEKMRRGWLDFDDLLLRARDLMRHPQFAPWVLWRLDGGIDHILVDEAQDTSPVQWELIEALTAEMTAGLGAERDGALPPRSVFVVGDPKQSIYGFQGADPEGFEREREVFREKIEAIEGRFQTVPLHHSFRSAPAVLDAVEAVLEEAPAIEDARHRAFFDALPGRVDLWPALEPAERSAPPDYDAPPDRPAEDAPAIVLARRIVDRIADMIDRGEPVPHREGGEIVLRPAQAGDFLILVRSRGAMFHEIIRHAKTRRVRGPDGVERPLEIAGADRLRVGAELAVRDLVSLMAFLALPEDCLSLAEALRSPLFGLSEGRLFDLAHGRTGYLWQALRARREEFAETHDVLRELRDSGDFLRPYELIERVLTHHGGRERLLARLGPEAEEGIDELLNLALAYERDEVPSLTGFVSWMRADGSEIKRTAEGAGRQMRVMTVHGAKGLEAPVVILPQTTPRRGSAAPRAEELMRIPELGTVWKPGKADMPDWLARHAEAEAIKQAEEDLRLLYVAMTRAESWLIVAGAGDMGKAGDAWHDRVRRALESRGAVPVETPVGDGLRPESGNWGGPVRPLVRRAPDREDLPAWVREPAAEPAEKPRPLSPSGLGGPKSMPGEGPVDGEAARLYGIHLHRLLEHLPLHPDEPAEGVASDLLLGAAEPALPEAVPGVLADAQRLLNDPALAPVFAPATLAEVEVTGHIGGLGTVAGVIDRLVVAPERILAVDYKSNALVPGRPEDVPEGILRQLGAYAALLDAVWTDRPVAVAVLWTRTGALMEVPRALADAALSRAEPVEVGGSGPHGADVDGARPGP